MIRATLAYTEDIAPQTTTFWFEAERPLRYEAGQYLDVYVPHKQPDSRGEVRTMSLSSSPTEPLLGVTTSYLAHGGSSFKRALWQLAPGDTVAMSDPMGDFVLPKDPHVPIVFVAGGVGITPVRSMVQWLLDTNAPPRNMYLIYIARSPEHMPYLPLLTRCRGLSITPVYTQTAPAGQQPHSRLSTATLLELIGNYAGKLIYLSGPEPMMDGYWRDLQVLGVPREQLVLDYFTGCVQL